MRANATLLAGFLVAGGAALGVLAAPTAAPETPPEPWAGVRKTLVAMQNTIVNVQTMIRNGVTSPIPGRGENWLEACCSYNLTTVRDGSAELRRVLDYLEAQYASRRDLDSVRVLAEIRKHVDEVETIFFGLKNTTSRPDFDNRMNAIVHPFNHMRRELRDLEACCPVDPPPAPAQ